MSLARTVARYRALLARSWRWEVSRAGGGVRRTSPVAVAASGARWREGRSEPGSGPADQRRRGRLGEREAAAREPGGTCGGGGGSRGAGSRNRFGAGEGRRVPGREEGWVRVGAEEPEGPWRGAVDTSRRAGGGGFPAPLLPPQLKDAEPGWGRGSHADLSSA